MALDFNKAEGKAKKTAYEAYNYNQDGDQVVRLFGGILPRYVYWLKSANGKDIPVECLAFDRELEKFTNVEPDYVQEKFPDLRCSWSYSINCIDLKDGKVKVFNLKKKLYEYIKVAAEDLGDPTDPTTGWDVVFRKVKTGPQKFNVEYTLQVLRCKQRALSEAELKLIQESPSIDLKVPRPTPDEVKALMAKISSGDEEPDAPSGEAVNELTT